MSIALFSSLDTGETLAEGVRTVIRTLLDDPDPRIDLQLMCFAFTDPAIAADLVALMRARPDVRVRVIADWNQSATKSASVLPAIAALDLPNFDLRYKIDLPYAWDRERRRLIYSYAHSKGMLHHKTLLLRRAGRPVLLVAGSFNWSGRGRNAYENVLILPESAQHAPVLRDFDTEFTALWTDPRLTATPARARGIFDALRQAATDGIELDDPEALARALDLPVARLLDLPGGKRQPAAGPAIVAFSGGYALSARETAGHAPALDRRRLDLLRPDGNSRPAPLTLNTLTLQALRMIPAGATIKVAMYALSNRVPEFQGLIDAARRSCRVELLLDRKINKAGAERLRRMAQDLHLPITVHTSKRRMHQKYLVCPEIGLVLTGTANMTLDATLRHADHRILLTDAPDLAARFAEDFDTICARLAQPGQPLAA